MSKRASIRVVLSRAVQVSLLATLLAAKPAVMCFAQTDFSQTAQGAPIPDQASSSAPALDRAVVLGRAIILDRAVAVVNRHVILASDLDDEIRLSILDPNSVPQEILKPKQALEKLISRALIEQQIRQEDMPSIEPSPEAVDGRLHEIRTELPVCIRQDCASDAGWKTFLAAHRLTEQRVDAYLRYRLEILGFIEQRFRQGIQISPQQVETYYRDTLAPQYAPGETVPPLNQVASRIQEILLQQQVNGLFDNWLANLRQQEDVEILDPALAPDPAAPQISSRPNAADPNSGDPNPGDQNSGKRRSP